jgi:hypothetical protein
MAVSYLTLNGINLDLDGAWRINRSLVRLLGGAKKRNSNIPMPYVHGRVAYTPWRDQVVYDLELNVFGKKDSVGAAHASVEAGKLENLAYLYDMIGEDEGITMPAVLHLATGNRSADAQVANWLPVDLGAMAVITFDLIVPAGAFSAVAS